jgi:hypothetical protein
VEGGKSSAWSLVPGAKEKQILGTRNQALGTVFHFPPTVSDTEGQPSNGSGNGNREDLLWPVAFPITIAITITGITRSLTPRGFPRFVPDL